MASTLSISHPGLGAPLVPARIKRKPPPTVDVPERYPTPDPLDPFAPLWVLRTRTPNALPGSSTIIPPYANPYGSQETLALNNGPGHAGIRRRPRSDSYACESMTTAGDVSTLVDGKAGSLISRPKSPPPMEKSLNANPIANLNPKRSHYLRYSQINTVGTLQAIPRVEQATVSPHQTWHTLSVDRIQSVDLASPTLELSSSFTTDVDSIYAPTKVAPLTGALVDSSNSGSESDSVSASSLKFKRYDDSPSPPQRRTQTFQPPASNDIRVPSRGTNINVNSITNPVAKPRQKAEKASASTSQSRLAKFLLPNKRSSVIEKGTDQVGMIKLAVKPVQTRSTATFPILEKKKEFRKIHKASISAPQALMLTVNREPKNSIDLGVRGTPSPLGFLKEYATSTILVSSKGISLVPQVPNRDLEIELREGGDDISRRPNEALILDSHGTRKESGADDNCNTKRRYITGGEAAENMVVKPVQNPKPSGRSFTLIERNQGQKLRMKGKHSKRSASVSALLSPSLIQPSTQSISGTSSIVNISMPIPSTSFMQHTSEGAYNSPRPAPRPPLSSSFTHNSRAAAEEKDDRFGSCDSTSCHYSSIHKATPQPAPPSAEFELPTAAQIALAAALPVTCENGSKITFGSLFSEHRTVVLFLRHFMCPLCQDYMSSLKELVRPKMLSRWSNDASENERLVSLVVISNSAPALIRRYKKIFGLPFLVYTDPDMEIYTVLGMNKGSLRELAGHAHSGRIPRTLGFERTFDDPVGRVVEVPPGKGVKEGSYVKHSLMGGIAMVLVRAIKVGMPPWENGGDATQLGGEFVFGPGLTCSFAHRMQTTRDHTPIETVLAAAGVNASGIIGNIFADDFEADRARVPLGPGERIKRRESTHTVRESQNTAQSTHTWRHHHMSKSDCGISEMWYSGRTISLNEEEEWMAERQRKIELLQERKNARRNGGQQSGAVSMLTLQSESLSHRATNVGVEGQGRDDDDNSPGPDDSTEMLHVHPHVLQVIGDEKRDSGGQDEDDVVLLDYQHNERRGWQPQPQHHHIR